jgi:hypothetical protein
VGVIPAKSQEREEEEEETGARASRVFVLIKKGHKNSESSEGGGQ